MTEKLLNDLTTSLSIDGRAFLPELMMCGFIVLMLLSRLLPHNEKRHAGQAAALFSLIALLLCCEQWGGIIGLGHMLDPRLDESSPEKISMTLFGGMLAFTNFTIFIKVFLFGFTSLVVLLTMLTGIPDAEDSADFYVLLFGSTIGMSIMASASHLLMVFIGIEMTSVPSYALAGFLKGRRQSSEAALKYVVYGGGASGVMLYGISLLAGNYGTGYLPSLVQSIGAGNELAKPIVILGVLFILIGLGFKLAAVPFHFWCPDVFEGAAAEVGAFLSVASKGAALALLARIVLGLGSLSSAAVNYGAWEHVTGYLVPILAVFAMVTTTFGNLAAYSQTNLKRLLAYSTIAHAGFMMMGLATMTRDGAGAVLFYLVTYLFMNLGAFAVVAFMRNMTGHEDLAYFRGFVNRAPVLVITLGIFLLSLLGMPPLAGFTAKFQIFSVLFDAGQEYAKHGKTFLSSTMYLLLIIGGLNTVLSLFYYVKVLKVMVLERTLEEVENRPIGGQPTPVLQAAYASILAAVVLGLGIFWNPLSEVSAVKGINSFRAMPAKLAAAPPPNAKGAK